MTEYTQRADRAIMDEQWHEAHQLLGMGIVQEAHSMEAYRMMMRRITLPLFREAVQYKDSSTYTVSETAAQEVHEELTDLLRRSQSFYDTEISRDPKTVSYDPDSYLGILAEIGVLNLGTYALTEQIDDTLLIPALSIEDRKLGPRNHDFSMYNRRVTWHSQPKTMLQLKHKIQPFMTRAYDPAVVVVGYSGINRLAIGKFPASSTRSMNHHLLREDADAPEQKAYLNRKWDRLGNMAVNWPELRRRRRGNTPS